MARHWGDGKSDGKGDGKSDGKAAAVTAAKGTGKGERGEASPAGEGGTSAASSKSWAQRNAGTLYIVGAFGLVVLIAAMRASCN